MAGTGLGPAKRLIEALRPSVAWTDIEGQSRRSGARQLPFQKVHAMSANAAAARLRQKVDMAMGRKWVQHFRYIDVGTMNCVEELVPTLTRTAWNRPAWVCVPFAP